MSMCISMSREAKHVPINVCVCVQSDNPFFCLSRKVSESESAVEAPKLKERTNVVSWESITNTNKIEEKNKIICAVHTSEQKRENAEQSVDLKKYTHTDERTKLVCWYWYACQDFECIGLFVWNGTVMLIKTFFFSWPRNQCKKRRMKPYVYCSLTYRLNYNAMKHFVYVDISPHVLNLPIRLWSVSVFGFFRWNLYNCAFVFLFVLLHNWLRITGWLSSIDLLPKTNFIGIHKSIKRLFDIIFINSDMAVDVKCLKRAADKLA